VSKDGEGRGSGDTREDLAPETLPNVDEMAMTAWVYESYTVARDTGYRKGALVGAITAGNAQVLPDDYMPAAKLAAERRLVMACRRAARALATILQPEIVPAEHGPA
jgi:hypothetical protein